MSELLIFAGSSRTESLNRKLARAAAEAARHQGAEATLIELANFDIPLYHADLEARGTPSDVVKFKQLLYAHPAWVICSPEYNAGITALLKNAIDWASSPAKAGNLHAADIERDWADGEKPFRHKAVGLLAASPGGLGGIRGLSDLSRLLLNLQCWVCPKQFALARAGSAFDANGSLVDARAAEEVAAVVAQTVWAGRRLADYSVTH